MLTWNLFPGFKFVTTAAPVRQMGAIESKTCVVLCSLHLHASLACAWLTWSCSEGGSELGTKGAEKKHIGSEAWNWVKTSSLFLDLKVEILPQGGACIGAHEILFQRASLQKLSEMTWAPDQS